MKWTPDETDTRNIYEKSKYMEGKKHMKYIVNKLVVRCQEHIL